MAIKKLNRRRPKQKSYKGKPSADPSITPEIVEAARELEPGEELEVATSQDGTLRRSTKTLRKRLLKTYPTQKCVIEGCTHNAVGKTDICKKHGGDPIIHENLLEVHEIPSSMLVYYDPAYHPMKFITLAREGKSEVEIAAEFGVGVGTVRGWSEKFKDFNTAYEIGQAMHEAWWLQEGKDNLDNRGYNTGMFKYITGNKLGWSEKHESKNLNISAGVLVVPKAMSEDDWEAEHGQA